MKKITTTVAAVFAVALLALPGTARGQDVQLGPQLSLADDYDAGLGGRAVFNVGDPGGWEGTGSFDVFFPDGDVDYWELNGNLVYNFPVEESRTFFPYLGGGLNIARVEAGTLEDTDLGVNIVGGSKFDAEGVTPFVEARVEIEGGEQFVLTGGFLFP
ncbi:MAG: hypothetical protein Q8W44_04910 [Candidatus Palauibacterales bacterium]|nr:hypothetical protein [Candidatus Palauibacterales bacterium]